MATVIKKYVVDLMRKERLPYFRMQDSATSIRPIAENDSESDVEAAIELLEEAIGSVLDNYCTIIVSNANRIEKKQGGDVKRYKHYEFRVDLSAASTRGAQGGKDSIAGPQMNKQYLDLLKENNDLQRKIERLEDQKRFDDLERKLKEFTTASPLDKLLSNEKFIEGVSGMLGGPKNGLAGVTGAEDSAVDENMVQRKEKLRNALNRLRKVDNRLDENIELLADFAEKNSTMYFASIEQIKKMLS